jgi:hypothetical protein
VEDVSTRRRAGASEDGVAHGTGPAADAVGHAGASAIARDPSRAQGWFWPALIIVTVCAFAIRIVFALTLAPGLRPASDSRFYRQAAARLADGLGYSLAHVVTGGAGPTAGHPPGLSLLLAPLDVVGLSSWDAHRLALCVVSALGVGVLGLAGRRLGGAAVGLCAAAIAALHPLWLQHAGMVVSEAIYLPVVAGFILLGVRCVDRPSTTRFGLLGALLGLAVLVRTEAVLLVPLLGGTVAVMARDGWRVRLVAASVTLAAAVLVVSPWVVRNYETFGRLTLSTNGGGTLAGANCPQTLRGQYLGSFRVSCAYAAAAIVLRRARPAGDRLNEASFDREVRQLAVASMSRQVTALPRVVGARVLRTWGLLRPKAELIFDTREGRHLTVQWVGQLVHWVLLPLALVGAFVLPRSEWRRWAILLAPLAACLVTAALVYGSTRIRAVAEPSIAVLAAVALVGGARRLRARPALRAA